MVESRPSTAQAFSFDRASMYLDKMTRDRGATEASMLPGRRVAGLSNRSKTYGRNSLLIPRPVSETLISTVGPTETTFTQTRPPLWVNFTAFDNKFQTTCWSLFASPEITADVVS